jgi:5,10-methylenetetrahydromethanopterin reductase
MPVPVHISLRIPGTAPIQEIASLVRDVEAAGFAGAGILDSQLLCRDVFVTMAAAAMQTSHITIFPAVTNPFTRHASVLASAVQSVEELAPGRVKCIIGTGYTSASTIGRKPATLAQMRACIVAMKGLLAGQTVDFTGSPGRLQYAAGRHIPVLMAASGPKAIELAGEIADGALLMVGYTPGVVAAALEHLERGARRGGRRLDDLEIIWAVRTGTAASTSEAQRQARTGSMTPGSSFPSSRSRRPSGRSTRTSPTRPTGRKPLPPPSSCRMRSSPSSARRLAWSARRSTAPRGSCRWPTSGPPSSI